MDSHTITAVHTHGLSFIQDVHGHEVITDTVVESGGNNEGPSPKRLMLAALAGCTGIDVVLILNKMKVPFSKLSIKVSATLSAEHPRIYNSVLISYSIKIPEADRIKMEKAVKLSERKYCGVSAMFKAFAKVDYTIIYV